MHHPTPGGETVAFTSYFSSRVSFNPLFVSQIGFVRALPGVSAKMGAQ
jgi:hypothetical protein